jgi:hypothetical protein
MIMMTLFYCCCPVPLYSETSTTLYITCIAGCQYNFIHITRILFNFANDIAGCQYNFIHITRILFNFANDIAGCQYNFIHITSILFNFNVVGAEHMLKKVLQLRSKPTTLDLKTISRLRGAVNNQNCSSIQANMFKKQLFIVCRS